MSPVDLRSDTVTRPTAAMRREMAEAEVGDDVMREDPTVRSLEEEAAAAVGHEAALFVPSGSMGNLIAVKVHTHHGDEVILDEGCHIFEYELSSLSAISGVMPRPYRSAEGLPRSADLETMWRPGRPYDTGKTAMLALENTHMLSGGTPHTPGAMEPALRFARERGVAAHLDGARIFNAAIALGVEARDVASGFDSVMFCFSKGLGAPVGSCLAGSRPLIEEARRVRKRLGGGMRQAGILAAAARYALRHHVGRLAEDHARARRLAAGLAGLAGVAVAPDPPPTNIVMLRSMNEDPGRFAERLGAEGVLAFVEGGRVRLVTHLDLDDEAIDRAVAVIRKVSRTPS